MAFRVAVAAAVTGAFSAADAAADFVLAAAGGLAIGFAAGWVLRRGVSRLDDRPLVILLSLLVPYAAYIAAEEAGVSGVLAVVVCGLYLGWHQHKVFTADTRLSAAGFWEVLVFGLNALVFLLLGLSFSGLVEQAREDGSLAGLTGAALLVGATVIVIRLAAQFVPGAARGRRGASARRWAGAACAVRSRWPRRCRFP